ncbi:MAG: DNA repair protein RecO [Candidatus Accumulibacter phosphatis]|uniref:DNA repair protein RecO n=2 Tax=Candidatus Accumulibacter TaxID=327159 RepID=A0A080LXP5_9PROT|nr:MULTISPECIES: DNA repair protein RecO [Candidatus Accumulibacter]KFB73476.1 MAG: Recombination protein O [Candidatus Accumulibacter phosphatis]MBL8409132.1 DNA repair protein RecO [Accumulibacter sp.]NMQ07549.1 DNA repair protein RecO [Candidatus Accumulibacter contiguus]HRF13217.1 DNA repair protein RecO [Candidatus Accumulibacter phosphatis]
MTQRHKVDAQPAFVLHAYPYSETSLIVDVFSRDHGRVALLARGARRPRSALRGVLQAFQPLELGWAGRGEVQTLIKAEWQGGQPLLAGKSLFCGYYLNELLMHLLPREDAHARLFLVYAETLQRFANGTQESDLRCFERALLQELGYGLTLETDATGIAVDVDAHYVYEIERGPVRLPGSGSSLRAVSGRTLLDLAHEDFSDPRSLAEAKQLMRTLINHYTDGKSLASRRIFRELHEL